MIIYGKYIVNMKNKLVHIDFKGAQPLPPSKAPFWEDWCRYLSKMCKVDGLLIEWEDCLPIKLLSTSNTNRFTYSSDDAKSLVHTAQVAGLTVVPLIQTFGHLLFDNRS